MKLLASIEGASGAGYEAALIALALIAAAAVLVRPTQVSTRLKAILMLAAVAGTPLLLAIDIWNSSAMRHLRDRPALSVGVVVAALTVVMALAVLFRRRPSAFPLAVAFALPLRLPVTSGGTTANLLVPLYMVIVAAAIAYSAKLLRATGTLSAAGRQGPPHSLGARHQPVLSAQARREPVLSAQARREPVLSAQARRQPPPPWRARLSVLTSPRALEWLLMATVVLYAVQAAYSDDFSKALQNMGFFYVPFALMLALLCEVRFSRQLLLRCALVSAALAVVFAGIGFGEYAAKSLLLNSKLVAANVYGNYFRVNSVFYDPNIYGRYLALVMLLLACIALSAPRRRQVWACAGVLAWLWAGLITSISQTSMVALLVGLAVLGGWRWGARRAAYVALALLALGVVALALAPSSLHFGLSGKGGSVNNATSGRASLVRGGIDLFADRPLTGFGSGSFASEYRAHRAASVASSTSASHTTPITIAAEQGIVGLLLYVALLLCCFGVMFAWAGRSPPRPDHAGRRLAPPFQPAIAACFTALLVHTIAYADFLEDPIAWALLGIGMALVAQRPGTEAVMARGLASCKHAASSMDAPGFKHDRQDRGSPLADEAPAAG